MASVERSHSGRPARLTQQVMEDIIAGVRTGSPVDFACEMVGVDAKELARWRREADAALYKPRRGWSDLERRAVEFFARLRQAQADAGMRTHMAVAQLAGLTRERPKRRRTTQRIEADGTSPVIVDEHGRVSGGRVVEVTTVEEEMAPSLAALKMMAAYRFPEQMGAGVEDEDEWSRGAPDRITNDQLLAILAAAGKRAGVTPEAIDTTSRALPEGDPDADPTTR